MGAPRPAGQPGGLRRLRHDVPGLGHVLVLRPQAHGPPGHHQLPPDARAAGLRELLVVRQAGQRELYPARQLHVRCSPLFSNPTHAHTHTHTHTHGEREGERERRKEAFRVPDTSHLLSTTDADQETFDSMRFAALRPYGNPDISDHWDIMGGEALPFEVLPKTNASAAANSTVLMRRAYQ